MEVGNFTIFQFLTFRGTLLPQNIYLATHIRVIATNAGVFFYETQSMRSGRVRIINGN